MFQFCIVIGAIWYCFPRSFYFDIHTDNHNFDLGIPLVAFSGIYENTNTGYLIKPNLFQLPISSTFAVQQMDQKHLRLFAKFVQDKNQNIKDVIRYVPDH